MRSAQSRFTKGLIVSIINLNMGSAETQKFTALLLQENTAIMKYEIMQMFVPAV